MDQAKRDKVGVMIILMQIFLMLLIVIGVVYFALHIKYIKNTSFEMFLKKEGITSCNCMKGTDHLYVGPKEDNPRNKDMNLSNLLIPEID